MLGNNTLDSLNKTTDEATLICHRLNQSKEHIDLKLDVKTWKQLPWVDKKMETIQILLLQSNQWQKEGYRYIGIAYAVKEQVDENKGNQQRILAQATVVEANDKVGLLERQTAQL